MNKYSQLALIFVGVLCLTESSTSFSMPSAFLELWTKDAKGHGNPLDNMQSYSYSLKDDEVCHDSNIIDYGLRLIGCENEVARQAGRLEIFYKGSWGTICDDQFDKYDAQVACYSLGYERYQGLPVKNTFYDGPTSSLIALDDVACTGNETVLDECDHANWELSNCAHSEDIGLACVPQEIDGVIHYGHPTRLVNGNENITNTGRLEIFHRGEWGTVCDDDFGHIDAAIACRALYLNFATGMFIRNEYGPGTGRIWLDTVTCTEDDINIGTCAHDPWGVHDCNHEEDVSIICGQCFDELCQNNSTCRDADTAGCQCQPGYTGMYCETRAEDCSQAACANGGTCFMFMNRWMCNCPVGYTGTFCETQMPSTITTIAPTTTSTDQQGTREQGTRDWSRETTREWTRETTREWPREVESTTANTEITPTSTPPRSSSDNWTW